MFMNSDLQSQSRKPCSQPVRSSRFWGGASGHAFDAFSLGVLNLSLIWWRMWNASSSMLRWLGDWVAFEKIQNLQCKFGLGLELPSVSKLWLHSVAYNTPDLQWSRRLVCPDEELPKFVTFCLLLFLMIENGFPKTRHFRQHDVHVSSPGFPEVLILHLLLGKTKVQPASRFAHGKPVVCARPGCS